MNRRHTSIVTGLLLMLAAHPAHATNSFFWGLKLQLLSPGFEGAPSLPALGLQGGYRWESDHFQSRIQVQVLGGWSTLQIEDTPALTAGGLSGALTGRLAFGGFKDDSAGYAFIDPGLFALLGSNPERGTSSLMELGAELGVGRKFKLPDSTHLDLSLTVLHFHLDPRTAKLRASFYPGLAVAFMR
ncbi:hypothetical protein JRI60_09165 [Archangium violaceum]|uniref:hypothetical protein n=1 Tax=Archangium violaceum TaxID=83451 RepID=UPI001951FE75|nr:hypothetical protein [Archangium violaceum]QRN99167.1 hypothetical protein JRI60_09165 [Archangium violaceum]